MATTKEYDPNSFIPEVTITLTYTTRDTSPKGYGNSTGFNSWNVSDELLNGLVNDERYDTEPAKSIMDFSGKP